MKNNETLLFINTAGKKIILGLKEGPNAFFYIGEETERKHTSNILIQVENLLDSSKIGLNDISLIGVVIGPGSFTGIRIGISTVNALSKALRVPIVSLNSLEISANKHERIVSLMDCLNGNFYALVKNSEKDISYKVLNKEEISFYQQSYNIITAFDVSPKETMEMFIEKSSENASLKRAIPFYLRESSADREEKNKDFYIIRKARTEDIIQILSIEKANFFNPWSEQMFLDEMGLFNSKSIVIEDKRDNLLIGYGFFRHSEETAELLRIAIIDSHKGAGFGTMILSEMFKQLKDLNNNSVLLEVSSLNESAIRLYQKNGFITDGLRKNYYKKDEHALLMRKLI